MDFLEWLQKYGKEMINDMQNIDYNKIDDHFKDSMDYNLFALKKSIETENKTILTASLADIFDNIAKECRRIKSDDKQDYRILIKNIPINEYKKLLSYMDNNDTDYEEL